MCNTSDKTYELSAAFGRVGFEEGTMNPALMKRMMALLMQGMSPDRIKEEAEKVTIENLDLFPAIIFGLT